MVRSVCKTQDGDLDGKPMEGRQTGGAARGATIHRQWAGVWALLMVSTVGLSCAPSPKNHELDWTGGQVRFARSPRAFYAAKWRKSFRAVDRRICAGFVHKEKFGRYLKYGLFDLRMKLEVFKGGTSKHDTSGRLVDWQGGRLLRTLVKKRPAHESQDAYVWCGSLRKGARWKVGAMRYTFWLHRDDPPKDIFLAKGIVMILP